MNNIYLTANSIFLGEVMDLQVVMNWLGPGEVYHLDDGACDESSRRHILEAIAGSIPIVAGGGTMMRFFSPFWDALSKRQKILMVGTGVCWPYGTNDAYPLRGNLDPRSRFRGPVAPIGFNSDDFIAPPGLLFKIPRRPESMVLCVHHPLLVERECQSRFSRKVASVLGWSIVECDNHVLDCDLYSRASLVITSRLHGAVMAAGNRIPCFVISRDHKIDWFCQIAGIRKISLFRASFNDLDKMIPFAISARAADISGQENKLIDALSKLSEMIRSQDHESR